MRLISNRKIEEFKERLSKEKINQAVFLCSEPSYDMNLQYFTGFRIGRGDSFACLVYCKEKFTLLVSPLEYEQAAEEAQVDEIIELKGNITLRKLLKEKLKPEKAIGINSHLFSYGASKLLPRAMIKNIDKICSELRSVKEPKEIEALEKSCQTTNKGIDYICGNLSTKKTEKELAFGLELFLRKKGAEEMAFDTVLTSGKRSSLIHPHPANTTQKISAGLGLIDFGIICEDYCSDITVPFSIGKLSRKQEKIIETVEKAYKACISEGRAGVPTWKLYETANEIIKIQGFELKHSLGHGIGLEVHEDPTISPKSKDKTALKNWKETILKENMVIAIEPGVYVPGIGGCRLENDFLVTKRGLERLTNARMIFC